MENEYLEIASYIRKSIYKECVLKDLVSFGKNMTGACAISSYALYKALKNKGLKVKFVLGHFDYYLNKHCWIEYKDKIIDITATQFGNNFSDVFVTDIKNERYKDRRYNIAALSEVNDWLQQSPRYHKNTINNIIKNLKY